MAHPAANAPNLSMDDNDEEPEHDMEKLVIALRRAAEHGHLLGLWNTLTLLNQRNDEMDAHIKSIDSMDENGETALSLAAINGHARVVQALMDKGADDHHSPSPDIPIPLVRAAAAGHTDCVAVLRHRSPEVAMSLLDACYEEGELKGHNALSIAALGGHSSVVRELLEEDPIADVHSGPYHGASLLEAARRGHGQVVDVLLQHGCDPNCHKGTGRASAILEAAGRLCWPVCALLVAYGGDVGEMEDHTALLEVSAFSLFLELDNAVSALLTQCNALGVDLDRPLSQGCTLLTAAVACGNTPGLQLLLKHGASPSMQDTVGNTPLSIAAALGLCDAVKALLGSGADPDACAGKQKEFPLQIALHLWHASAQQAQLRHAPSFDEDDDSACMPAMPVVTDVVGNAVARNALAAMEQEGAESTEFGQEAQVAQKAQVRSEVMELLARRTARDEKLEAQRDNQLGWKGGEDEESREIGGGDGADEGGKGGVRGVGADAARLRRKVADFWGSNSGSLDDDDTQSGPLGRGAKGGPAEARKMSDSDDSDSFHDSSALPVFMGEADHDTDALGVDVHNGVGGDNAAGHGVMNAAIESTLSGLDEELGAPGGGKSGGKAGGNMSSPMGGVITAPRGHMDRGDEYLHCADTPATGTGAEARGMAHVPDVEDDEEGFPGSLSSFSALSHCSVDKVFPSGPRSQAQVQGGLPRHIFAATTVPDEMRFTANSAGLNTVNPLDAALSSSMSQLSAGPAAAHSSALVKGEKRSRGRAALETPLSAASSSFLVPLTTPYRPLQKTLAAQYRPLSSALPSDLDLCDIEGRGEGSSHSNSLSAWNQSAFAEDKRQESRRSRFLPSGSFGGSGGLLRSSREKRRGGLTRVRGGAPPPPGFPPLLRSKVHRSISSHSHGSSRHSLSCFKDSSDSPPARGYSADRYNPRNSKADFSLDSPTEGSCMAWPKSMSMSRSSQSATVARQGSKRGTIPLDSGDQPQPCCTPSVGALWLYVAQCWTTGDATEGLRAGAKDGAPGQSPASSLGSASIAAGPLDLKNPHKPRKGSPLRGVPSTSSSSATPSSTAPIHPIPLTNETFGNARPPPSPNAPVTKTPLISMHAAAGASAAAGAAEISPAPGGAAPSPHTYSSGAAAKLNSTESRYSTPTGDGRKGTFGAGSDRSVPPLQSGREPPASPVFHTPDSSANSVTTLDAAGADTPSQAIDSKGVSEPVAVRSTSGNEMTQLSTEFAVLAQSMAAEGAAWDDSTTGVSIDGMRSKGSSPDKSGDVTLSLKCPQVLTDGSAAQQAAASPHAPAAAQPRGLAAVDRWSFEDLPKVHGDVEDSGTLDLDSDCKLPQHPATPFRNTAVSHTPVENSPLNVTKTAHAPTPKKKTAATSALIDPSQPRKPVRRKRTLQFRMDGDVGLMSCVRVLFAASKDARSLISEDMKSVLLEHGVLKRQDILP